MFEGGIGPEELAEIERDEFVHYLPLAYVLGDPRDWPRFRPQLLDALTAARALEAIVLDRDPIAEQLRVLRRRQAALDLIEDVRRRYDPTTAWPAFFEALWEQRAVMDGPE